MNSDVNSLCCCEYIDVNNERNHILASCCNCVDIDEAFENIVSGSRVSPQRKERIMKVMLDRIRIPWLGGAKLLAVDAIIPLVLVPVIWIMSSINFMMTVIMSILSAIFLRRQYVLLANTRTKFFFMWALVSFVFILLVFEYAVVSLLEILLHENIILVGLAFTSLFCLYQAKLIVVNGGLPVAGNEESNTEYCQTCQAVIVKKDHHSLWVDYCINTQNRWLYTIGLFFMMCTLVYSTNLTLTTICHPFRFYKSILLPDDCSDVYEQLNLALAFVNAVYSLIYTLFVLFLFLDQIFAACRRGTSKSKLITT